MGDAATRRHGDAAIRRVWGWGVLVGFGVFSGWGRDSCRVPVVAGGEANKDQGGRVLTAIGSGGGAVDRMVYRGVRHHAVWVRSRRRSGWLGLPGLGGLLGLALLQQLLQFVQGSGEGTLQAHAAPVDAVQQIKLGREWQVCLGDPEL